MAPVTRQDRVRQSRHESRARIVAAAETLVRSQAYSELSVDAVMAEAGQGRTTFYRHFDDLADLLQRAGREAIEELLVAQEALGEVRPDDRAAIRAAMASAVAVYERHGPLLRGLVEAAAGDPQISADYEAMRGRFDELVARSLRADETSTLTDPLQTARALNLLNEHYLLDAFGREPRVTADVALQTLTEIWEAVVRT